MKKKLLLLVTSALLISGVSFAQTGKDAPKAKKDTTLVQAGATSVLTGAATAKKPMPKACPGKTCGKTKS
jgi:hypothetical protein